jgi:hypothetical protein
MAGGGWQITNRATAGAAASASQAAPTNGSATGMQLRLRSIVASIVGTANMVDRLVVRDGATGVGTIIFSADLGAAGNSGQAVPLSDLDVRASKGNALTVEFVSGSGTAENVAAQGDLVPVGYPIGAP